MKRLLTIVSVLAIGIGHRGAGSPSPGTNYTGPHLRSTRSPTASIAVGTGSIVVMSNATIIEGDRDVLVVDSHVSPGGAWRCARS